MATTEIAMAPCAFAVVPFAILIDVPLTRRTLRCPFKSKVQGLSFLFAPGIMRVSCTHSANALGRISTTQP